MGYDVPGCVEDGTWMLWENYSVAFAAVAHFLLKQIIDKLSCRVVFHEECLPGSFVIEEYDIQP